MSGAEERNNKRVGEDRLASTASFSGSGMGPGSQIGRFRIERELGRGGMGVVYLAHDTKLNRPVAIKSLPAQLMGNAMVRKRWKREAQVLASLNHPNIAAVYEEVEGGEGYLVLEYVPGDTLAERITHGPLRLEEALSIALQVADAVAAAHEKGVVHRDLKGGNIKITPEGKVKVLDFGLAKAVGGEVPDQRTTATEPGKIIGTPAYMSPEQARGDTVDHRSDIWSFGCVLYEMLTGRVPFEGKTTSDTLANILSKEPDWQVLPQTTPANIQVLLRRCLEKDPRRRLQHIGDAAIEISETLNLPAIAPPFTRVPLGAAGPKRLERAALWAFAGLMFLIAGVALWTSVHSRPSPPAQVVRFPISLPQSQMLNEQDSEIAVSPDGKRLVYLSGVGATRQLFLRELDQVEGKELPETKGASQPFFSPDGQSIGFQAGGKLKTLFLDGGRPKILCDASKLAGGTWCPDDTIFFTPAWSMGLWKVSSDGGDPEQVTTPKKEKGEFGHWWPEVLPGGETVLFTIWKTSLKDTQVAALIRETGESRILVTGASHARYAPTGHLLYAQSGTLVAAPFDLKQLKVGEPRPVIEGLKQYPDTGYAPFSFSRDGLLCYVRGGEWLASRQFVWVNRNGQGVEPLPLPPQAYTDPRISPDGRRIAFTKFDRGAFNIWVHELPSGPATQITFESSNFLPVWMPDGNTLTFTSYRAGPFDVYSMPANRSGPEELLLTGPCDHIATSWSPDGKVLLFIEINPDTGEDIGLLSGDDANTPQPLLHETCAEVHAVFSPDGNWIAYQSDQEGQNEVYVTPYPGLVAKKISTGGGYYPLWSGNGKELFYLCGDKMIAATIETKPEFKVTGYEVLFEGQYFTGLNRNYDVSPDGQRFLMIKESEEQPSAAQLILVLNWFEELKRLVPSGNR